MATSLLAPSVMAQRALAPADAPPLVQAVPMRPVPAARPLPVPAARSSGLMACLVLPQRTADLGSQLPGVVESVAVDRGDTVRQGQVLVHLRADVEAAQRDAARVRADSEGELRGAMAAEDLALQRLQRARRLETESFVSTQAVEQAETEWRIARERSLQARDARDLARREAGVSSAQVGLRILRAPFDGVVTERFAHPGERFEDKPLLRIAAIDALRVEVVVPAAMFGEVRQGQLADVQPELPGVAAREARVTQIDRVLDPASNTFRVRLDLPNADRALPAGMRCRVDFRIAAKDGAGAAGVAGVAGVAGAAAVRPASTASPPAPAASR